MTNSPQLELTVLLERLFEDNFDESDRARLNVLLASSSVARQTYLAHLGLHSSLTWRGIDDRLRPSFDQLQHINAVRTLLLEEGVTVENDRETFATHETINLFSAPQRAAERRAFALPPRLVGFAASLLLASYFVAMAGLLIWNRVRHIDEHERRGTPAVATNKAQTVDRATTVLTAMTNCIWEEDSQILAPYVGEPFGANGVLALRSGVAQLTFGEGAVVHIEGPARFVVRSSRSGFLKSGRLLAQVPHRAIGFCLTTPTMDVVDLGTEFGVQANEQDGTEVQVLRGRVEVAPAVKETGDRRFAKRVQLVTGEMISGNKGGLGTIATAHGSEKFSKLARATCNDFSTDPRWTGWCNTKDGNEFGWRPIDNNARAGNGSVGGTFARCRRESYYGDTSLSQTFTLNDPISASGLFSIDQFESMDGQIFIGHYSSSTADKRREFIGLELQEGDFSGVVDVTARLYRPDGRSINGTKSPTGMTLGSAAGYFHFNYTYDPTFEADEKHSGPEGKITLRIYNDKHSFDQTAVAVLEGDHRDSGAAFDAFGVGIPAGAAHNDDPKKTAELFIDDVSYSGFRGQ